MRWWSSVNGREQFNPPSHRNLPAQPVVAHVQELQQQTLHRLWHRPANLVMVNVRPRNALAQLHLGQVELEQVPRDVDVVVRLVFPE